MARRLSGMKDVQTLAQALDAELSRLETVAKSGVVSKNRLASLGDSYFFMDEGVLKFFNATEKSTLKVKLE
jgi:hypothetical protein